jgi:hypothetical protein
MNLFFNKDLQPLFMIIVPNIINGWHGYFYSIVLRQLSTFPETSGIPINK